MIVNLSQKKSVLGNYLSELRHSKIQQDRMRFRTNLNRIGFILGYEISEVLEYRTKSIKTPLGTARQKIVAESPVLATILRAGIGLHEGLLQAFDDSESAFVSAYRKHETEEKFDIKVEYMASPSLEDKTLVISDPMLATGKSMFSVYHALLKNGTPNQTIIASVISSPEALEFLEENMPKNTLIFTGDIDRELTAQSYIVPGLGDAGDLAYGSKIDQ